MSDQLTRNFKIESIRADEKQEGFWATLSTEYAVPRGYGNEILLHDPNSLDLSRAPFPLVISHNTDELNIGVVEQVEIIGRKLKGFIRLGKSSRAAEILKDIKAGILTGLSIGYHILESYREGDDLYASKWAIHEVSLVSVGADPNAGIGRSFKNSYGEKTMTDEITDEKLSRSQRSVQRKATEDERERIQDIDATSNFFLDKENGLQMSENGKALLLEEKTRFIESGWGSKEFQARARDILNMYPALEKSLSKEDLPPGAIPLGGNRYRMPGGHMSPGREFSVTNLIRSVIDPRSVDAGYELEVSQELRHQTGRRGKELLVPLGRQMSQLEQRSMVAGTDAAGGHLVDTILYSDRFIDALAPQSVVLNLGITQMQDLQGDAAIPKADSNPAVNAYNLDDVDTITPADPTLDQITLSPRSLAGVTVLSHKMITQGSMDTESLVRRMLATSIGVELDRQCIQGDGIGSNITGVTNATGIGAITYPLGGAPDWANIVNLEAELTADNVSMNNVAYLIHPTMAATLKTAEVATNTGRFILENGMMNGRPVHVSTNVPAGTVLIGAWSEFVLGTWGVLALDIDPYTDFRKGNVQVRAILDYDAAVRHPEAFAVSTESS